MISHSKELYLDLKTQLKINQHTFHLNLKLQTLRNLNGKCSQPNDYTNKTTNGIQKTFITIVF
jgi:hypothetical protein